MQKREAILFIDGSNFYHNSKSIISESDKVDFNLLAQFICDKFDLGLKQIRYYNAVPDIKDDKDIYYQHLSFLDKLKKNGIVVKTRKLKYIKTLKTKIEKGVDVLIASDMIRKTLVEKECKVCILISGDSDFMPAIEIIKKSGYEVIVSSPKQGFSNELRQGKFRYIILKKEDLKKCLNIKMLNYNSEDLVNHHGIAAIIKNDKDKILMQKHKKYGFWTIPVGKVKNEQDVEEALKEEIKEETNLDVEEFKEIAFKEYEYNRNGRDVKVFGHLFEILKYKGEMKNNEPNKHSQQIFIDLDEIIKIPYLSDLTLLYLENIGIKRKNKI